MSVRGLEQREKEAGHAQRRQAWVNGLQWSRSEEASPKRDLWESLAVPTAQRRGVARAFADAVGDLRGVCEIWVVDLVEDLEIAVSLDDLELESPLRNKFIDLVCERLDPREGELYVFPSECVPDWVRNKAQLV